MGRVVYRYTHFFYTLESVPPFRVLATSSEFCIGAAQDATDCESVQFVSGLALEANGTSGARSAGGGGGGDSLLLSYGINDCEAKLARMSMEQVWSMLLPIPDREGGGGSGAMGGRRVCTSLEE